MTNHKIYTGDCSNVLQNLAKGLYCGCLCDPPYGLDFAGSKWDNGVPSKTIWEYVFDLLAPGSHLIAYGGTRTYHRLVCNIEDAGFQIRDSILTVKSSSRLLKRFLSGLDEKQTSDLMEIFGESGLMAWMYGTGMPKNSDISKMFDKINKAKREVVGTYKPPGMSKEWNLTNAKDERTVNIFASSRNNLDVTKPGSQEGILWDGFGTALKPIWEPIVVAIKPIDGNYISNARKYGVAGINIDGSRIKLMNNETPHDNEYIKKKSGRWPTNLILMHDEECEEKCVPWCPVPAFKNVPADKDKHGMTRFIYCQKPDKKERNSGLSEEEINGHPTLKPIEINKMLANMILPPATGKERRLIIPYSGTGSEIIGALQAGWDFVEGIEKEPDFINIAEKRISFWRKNHEKKGN